MKDKLWGRNFRVVVPYGFAVAPISTVPWETCNDWTLQATSSSTVVGKDLFGLGARTSRLMAANRGRVQFVGLLGG